MNISIDFTEVGDNEDFFAVLKTHISLPDYFGDNLDALYDWLTGGAEMPLRIEFVNLSVEQLETFEDLLTTMEDAAEETDGLEFSYFMEQFED